MRRFPAGVVIASRDRRASLLSTLARLEALPEHPPVVVVDNASRDGTPAAVRRAHPHVRLIALHENLGAAARTVGVRELGMPVAAFCDDDSWWAPGSLSRIAELMGPAGSSGTHVLGLAPKMKELERLLTRVAKLNSTVLISGETGSGKEVAARFLHAMSGTDAPSGSPPCSGAPSSPSPLRRKKVRSQPRYPGLGRASSVARVSSISEIL